MNTRQLLPYAQLVRLPNVFTAMADIAMAGLVSGALPEAWLTFVFLLAASSLLYCSGMVWNDIFDIEQDSRERPFRPLPSGRVSRGTAVLLAAALMACGVGCAVLADALRNEGWQSTTLAALLAAMIVLYDRWAKRTWAGPLAMGSCRSLNVLLGLSILPGAVPTWGIYLAAVVGVYIVGVTWFARTEARDSNQTVLQAAATVVFASLVLALALPVISSDERPHASTSFLFPYVLVAFGFWIGLPISKAIRRPLPAHVQAAVKRMVLGLILYDAILTTALAGILGICLVVLLLPARYLAKWLYAT
jgi:4-hydroxybenzoate polyprenyltransferase